MILIIFTILLQTAWCSSMLPSLSVSSDMAEYYEPDKDTGGVTSCLIGYFLCNDTRLCIAQRLNCNNEADCYDGSDEWNCNDRSANLFWDSLFRKDTKALTDNIPWGYCDFNPVDYPILNSTCRCKNREIHCQFKNLVNIPSPLPDGELSLLDLSGNQFPVLNNLFLESLPSTSKLVFKHCSIEKLHTHTFNKFKYGFVDILYLDQNQIEILPDYLFPEGSWLQSLILAGNNISDIHENAFANLDRLYELDLRNNHLYTFRETVFKPLQKLQILFLNGNRLGAITSGMMPRLPELVTLSLADNHISYIADGALSLASLEHLFLSNNKLKDIGSNMFQNLPNMMGLNLNDNDIERFQIDAFRANLNLTSLYLTGNPFRTLNPRVLQHLKRLQHIYFSWFHLCRAALHVRVCEPHGDGISSAQHLLDNTILRASVWVMAAIGIFGNILVLCGRLMVGSRTAQGHAEHSMYLRHLAASDLLMGIYLAIIASADILFRGEYLAHEESWRFSAACSLCGFLSTLSCQSSTLLLTLVTWDRLVSVTRPLYPRQSSKARAAFRLGALWAISSATAAAPLSGTAYFGPHFYGNNGVCLSLHIHDPYAKGWEYSAAIFICVNTFSLLFIGASYVKMLQAIRGSGEAMRSTLSGRENIVARRFAIIVGTDCACWLPVIVVKLAALAGVNISPSLYAWLAVLVLPVNSALNPVLYTLTTAAFKQQLLKFCYSVRCGDSNDIGKNGESAISLSVGHFQNNGQEKKLLQRRVSILTNNPSSVPSICTKNTIHPINNY